MILLQDFYEWHIGNVIELGALGIGIGGYLLSRRTETRERREGQAKALHDREEALERQRDALTAQIKMHTENSERLRVLMNFHEVQQQINVRRDEQIGQLTALASGTAEMLRGFNRRLQLMEDENRDRRNRTYKEHDV